MLPKCLRWKEAGLLTAALVLLTASGLRGAADPPAGKTDWPKLPPKEIVETWKKARAEAGWMGVNRHGFLVFLFEEVKGPEENSVTGVVPAFRFMRWHPDVAKLPAPASAFGLDLGDTLVNDDGLKELA